jgi:hypothetical protein
MPYQVNSLFEYKREGKMIYRYLFDFITNDDITKSMEIEMYEEAGITKIDVIFEESDELNKDDTDLFYYLLNHWAQSLY